MIIFFLINIDDAVDTSRQNEIANSCLQCEHLNPLVAECQNTNKEIEANIITK